jgi:hypothetical protein
MKRPLPPAFLLAICFVAQRARAGRSCVEVSDVVGERQCSRYGSDWSVEGRPAFVFRFGFRYAELATDGMHFHESFKKGSRPPGYAGYSFDGAALGLPALTTFGPDGGVTFYLFGQLYLGVDVGFGFGSHHIMPFTAGAFELREARGVDTIVLHGGLPLGYRMPLGLASLRPEIFFGGESASVFQNVRGPGSPGDGSASAGCGLIETRMAADLWLTQHLSLSAYGGVNVLDGRSMAMGLTFAWHVRAFDGDYAVW